MKKPENDLILNQLAYRMRNTQRLDIPLDLKKELIVKIFKGFCRRIVELNPEGEIDEKC